MNRYYYQTLCIINPALSEQEVAQTIQKYSDLIAEHGGTEIKYNNLGKKLVAYPFIKKGQGILIKTHAQKYSKQVAGIYIQIQYLADSKKVGSITRKLRANKEVLRCLIIKLKSNNNDKRDEENDEQPPALSPEERKRIKEENINYLNRTVDQKVELYSFIYVRLYFLRRKNNKLRNRLVKIGLH
ncbi:30S ribosomal protein S6 [Anabaena aphanizomenioides LEGE 00250]|jgi:small subunit ribosomal protein S6|uniref:Small ribosomal subunit protein bS6 n=1 Tax=Sphaerospermopsis aphanizomenoides LEGE 00250 TaxID=2777972 RepID=A0ABR9V8I2_9CYAN|nr:30S ribosomal protein S6 [Sphaerospermopsis aphanizomenoides]MBE9234801.1 30S ribosomal protein S6 [Sphaerospermopsis aphanizomenoides LEGE 00250]